MSLRPKKRTAEIPAAASTLLTALQFCGLITKDIGPINETHIYLQSNWACAYNGTIAAGHPIAEDIYACPHSRLIIEALGKCSDQISFTQLDANKLSIKSGKFKAIVPCIDPTLLHIAAPDPPVALIDDRFKEGLSIVGILANDSGQLVHLASILMNGYSLISTNGKVIIEYWHGLNLPNNIALPKALVDPLTKTSKKLAKFGFSQSSVTFYFEDESWIRSQLYAEAWPDISPVLDRASNAWPVSGDFFRAIEAVEPFSDGFVYSRDGKLHSHSENGMGASFECPSIPGGLTFSPRQMALIKPWVEKIDFFAPTTNEGTCIKAFGANIRCVIAGIR